MNEPDSKPESKDARSLTYAALVGDFELAKRLVDDGADLNERDERERTAMMIAIGEDYGALDWVSWLLQSGGDPNLKDVDGNTVLDYAIFYQHKSVIELLDGIGANRADGESALQRDDAAIYAAFEQADAVKRLVILIEKQKGRK